MHKLNRKYMIQRAVMTVIFLIAAFLVYRTTILTRMILPHTQEKVSAEEGLLYPVQDGDHIEQTFLYDEDELLSVGIRIRLDEEIKADLVSNQKNFDLGVLHLQILDEDRQPLMNADYQVYTLDDEQNLLVSFPGMQTGWKNQQLTIVMDAEDVEPDVELSIGYTEKEKEHTSLEVNGETCHYTLNIQTADHQFFYWKKLFLLGAFAVWLLLMGTHLGLAKLRLSPERVFLFTGAVLAGIYMVLLPPLSVPDEEVHLKEAYAYANVILGKEPAKDGRLLMDLEDYHALQKFDTTPSLSEYDTFKEELFRSGREEGTKEVKLHDTQAPMVTYLPGIVGITLARALGLNGLLVFFFGRICSILWYLFMMYWFIRLMPFGKAAAFIAAILPMTIQQCCSYSYDAVIIEAAFLYLAVLFGLLYKEEPIRKWQIAVYVLCMILLSICKGGTYMPLCLLTMMIPVSRFRDKKQKWIFVGSMACVAVAAFLTSTLSYVLYVASPTAEQAAGTYLGADAYGAAGLLQDPLNFICLTVRTIFLSGDGFIETMLGMQLGWLNIFVSRIVIYGMLAFMILAVLQRENCTEDCQMTVTTGQKVFYLAAAAMSAAMVFASLFMSWTPKNATAIAGIQGRYFLPTLPVLLLVFRNKNVTIKRNLDRKLIFLAVCLQCAAIYGILMSLERMI